MKSGVYEIVNTTNGRRYIGSAKSFRCRFATHRSSLRSGTHHSRFLQNSWKRYGESSFAFRKLLYCDPRSLLLYEQRAIDKFKPEFNSLKVAGSPLGYRHTEETRKRMSAAQARVAHFRGRKHSKETLAIMSESKLGNTHTKGKTRSPDAVRRTADAHRGMKRSAQTRARISLAMRGKKRKPYSKETLLKMSLANRGKGSLIDEQVKQIREMRASGMKRIDIAKKFQVSASMITMIVQRKRYGWVS